MIQEDFHLDGRYVSWRVVRLLAPLFRTEALYGGDERSEPWQEFPSRLQLNVSGHAEAAASKTILNALTLCVKAGIDGKEHLLASNKRRRIEDSKMQGRKPTETLNSHEETILEAAYRLDTEVSKLWLLSAEQLVDSGAVASVEVLVRNKLGVHARPTGMFCKVAKRFSSHIFLSKDDEVIDGKRPMGVMMLAAGPGSLVKIFGAGDDAVRAMDELALLFKCNFHEE